MLQRLVGFTKWALEEGEPLVSMPISLIDIFLAANSEAMHALEVGTQGGGTQFGQCGFLYKG